MKYAAALALLALFALCAYRAAKQAITVDEAYVYQKYIQGKRPGEVFTIRYDSANHVLQTLLAYRAVHTFGRSELAIRLPSLIGAFFYFLGIWRLSFYAFRRQAFAALTIGLLALNPLLLDHMSLARGYGIALALFTWSLYYGLRFFREHRTRDLLIAGVTLGLCVAANLTFAIPGVGLALTVLLMLRRQNRPVRPAIRYCLAGILPAALLLAVPLSSVAREQFYFGNQDLRGCIMDLCDISLLYTGKAPITPDDTVPYHTKIRAASFWLFPAMLGVIALLWLWSLRTRAPIGLLQFAAGSLVTAVLFLVLGHQFFHLLYPYDRTGLYLIFLFPLAVVAAIDLVWDWDVAIKAIAIPAALAMGLVVIAYGLELHSGPFVEWPFADDVKGHLATIRSHVSGKPVRLGGSSVFQYMVNFYRDANRWTWLERMGQNPRQPGFDYYLLLLEDRPYVDRFHLRVLSETPDSILAEPLTPSREGDKSAVLSAP
ncbi:MAG TPA: glycosyltransferase family 39 protein [Bryobacteraceae bacterium]|nr:glycosyltransferase family 39 protein [Bryobacteraceae bacterium]